MERAGANGLLSVTPYYNKPTPDGLVQHYKAIAESTSLPIIVYNVPGRTGCNVDPATLVKLAAIPNIIGVKEASGNIQQMCEICRAVPADFIVLSGDDAITLPLMAVGGRGVISVASNEVPREMSQMVEAAERGDFAAAQKIHATLLPLMLINFVESNPIPVKAAMAAMGLLEEAYRLPMVPPRQESRAKILNVLSETGTVEECLGQGERVSDSASSQLAKDIERLYQQGAAADKSESRSVFAQASRRTVGRPRALGRAGLVTPTGWRVNTWVKQGILVGFRCGDLVDVSVDGGRWFFGDKDTLPLKKMSTGMGVRVVPGGSSIRDGAYVAKGVICVPPMYINIGAYVDESSLVDSHALVGSCAQIGKRVHISAGAQIGGVIEPVGAIPVIIEDDVLVGGNTGIYEGAVIKRRAVIGAGTILTGSTPIYDLPQGRIIKPEGDAPLVVPEGAVVVPGRARSRKAWDRSGGSACRRPSSSNIATKKPTPAPTWSNGFDEAGIGD